MRVSHRRRDGREAPSGIIRAKSVDSVLKRCVRVCEAGNDTRRLSLVEQGRARFVHTFYNDVGVRVAVRDFARGGESVKVVLRKDVPTLGKVGDVKEVADGYGRNYLIPRGLAVLASRTAMENVEAHKVAEARQRARLDDEAQALAKLIEGTPLVLHARTGEGGRLYGSVTSADIAGALSAAVGTTVDKRNVDLAQPIRHLGSHTARIHVAPRVTVPLSVQVEPE